MKNDWFEKYRSEVKKNEGKAMSKKYYISDNLRRTIHVGEAEVGFSGAAPGLIGVMLVFDDRDKAKDYCIGDPVEVVIEGDNEEDS